MFKLSVILVFIFSCMVYAAAPPMSSGSVPGAVGGYDASISSYRFLQVGTLGEFIGLTAQPASAAPPVGRGAPPGAIGGWDDTNSIMRHLAVDSLGRTLIGTAETLAIGTIELTAQTSAPASAQDGWIYYNSTDDDFYGKLSTGWASFVTAGATSSVVVTLEITELLTIDGTVEATDGTIEINSNIKMAGMKLSLDTIEIGDPVTLSAVGNVLTVAADGAHFTGTMEIDDTLEVTSAEIQSITSALFTLLANTIEIQSPDGVTYFKGSPDGNIAIGKSCSSTGSNGKFAIGNACTTTGQYGSGSLGYSSGATGNYGAIAIGANVYANATSCLALGRAMTVTGTNSTGIGLDTTPRTLSQANSMVIMGGDVGIGTTSPVYTLEVGGTGYFSDDLTAASDLFVDGTISVGTNSEELKITIDKGAATPDGGILAIGTYNSGTDLSTSGAGTRMIWYPKKGAFRAGTVSGGKWDNANIGAYSVGLGYDVQAGASVAFGAGDTITLGGIRTVALGHDLIANQANAVAIGQYITSNAANCTIIGEGVDNSNRLTCSGCTSSVQIGTNSTIPTVFVGPGTGAGTLGKVGIGTTSPVSILDVNGTATFDAVNASGAVDIDGDTTVDKFTASETVECSSALIVTGGADLNGELDVDGTTNLDDTDVDGTFTQDAGIVVFNEDSGDYDFRVEGNGDANLLFCDAGNDKIGIGTNSPVEKLDVRGSAIFNEDGGDNDFRIEGDADPYLFCCDAGNDYIGIGTNTPSVFFEITNSVWLDDTPIAKIINLDPGLDEGSALLVRGGGNESHTTIFYVQDYGGNDVFNVWGNGDVVFNESASAIDGDVRMESANDTHMFFLDSSISCIGIGTNAPTETLEVNGTIECIHVTETSDERLKENIVDLDGNVIEKIKALKARKWDWKDHSKGSSIGFVAQEIEQIMPEAVVTHQAVEALYRETSKEVICIRPAREESKAIVPSIILTKLVQAVQELTARIEALEGK